MAKQQTRTSGGAYQNPTEGIVDYGAFGRGFEKNLKPGLDFLKDKQKEKKEEKEPEFDSTVNSASGNDFNFNQKGANSLQESLKKPVLILGEKWKAANGDVQKQQEIFDELNRMNVGKKRAVGFLASFAKNFNASDRRLMPEIVPGLQIERFEESLNKGNARLGFGKDETGSEVFGIHINTVDTDFEAIKAQNAMGRPFPADIAAAIKKDPSLKERLFLNKGIAKADRTADLELFKGPKRTFKATQNLKKIFIPTENLTEEDIMLKYFKPPSNLDKHFAEIVKENGVDTKTNEADIVKDVTSVQYLDKNGNIVTATDGTQVLSKNGYEKIDIAAEQVANEIITKDSYRENKDSLYIDAIFGTRKDIALNSQTPIGPYIKGFGEEGFKFDGKSYTEADFLKIGSNGKIGGDIPLSIRNAVSKSYAIDRYKIQKGSFGYHGNEFGHAVPSTIPADTKKVTKLDDEKISTTGSVQDIVNVLPKNKGALGSLSRGNILGGNVLYYTTNVEQQRNLVNTMNLVINTGPDSTFHTPQEAKDMFFDERRLQKNEKKERIYTDDDIKEEWNSKVAKGVFSKNNSKLPAPMWRLKSGKLEPIILDASPYSVFNYITDNVITNAEKALKVKNEYKKMIENKYNKQN